jgi:hypothetical protein
LLSTFKPKTAFLAIFRPKSAGTGHFGAVFVHFGRLGRLILLLLLSPPAPRGWALPPPIVGAPSSF